MQCAQVLKLGTYKLKNTNSPTIKVFCFFELRAAAVDMSHSNAPFDPVECRRRIDAQLDTLIEKKAN